MATMEVVLTYKGLSMFLIFLFLFLAQPVITTHAQQNAINTLRASHIVLPQTHEEKIRGIKKAYELYVSEYRWGSAQWGLLGTWVAIITSLYAKEEIDMKIVAGGTLAFAGLAYLWKSQPSKLEALLKEYAHYAPLNEKFQHIKSEAFAQDTQLLTIALQAQEVEAQMSTSSATIQIKMLYYKSKFPLTKAITELEKCKDFCRMASNDIAYILETHTMLTHDTYATLNALYCELQATAAFVDRFIRWLSISDSMQTEKVALQQEQDRQDKLEYERILFEQQKLIAQAQMAAANKQTVIVNNNNYN